MPKIDVAKYIEQSGIRKARFGGYEPEDVKQAMLSLCTEYEQRLTRAETALHKLEGDSAALEQHCRSLTAQNQKLATQTATLAGSSETYSRRMSELDIQLSTATEKIHSLTDQLAVLRLKNRDLMKTGEALKEETSKAQDELRMKGRALDDAKEKLESERSEKIKAAEQTAAHRIADARAEADKIDADAQLRAEAIERAARAQAQMQAQKIIDAAAAEANEVQNAHQLRLSNLHNEVRELEKHRDAMLKHLNELGSRLVTLHDTAEIDLDISEQKPAEEHEDMPELSSINSPTVQLNLSGELIADTIDKIKAENQPETKPEPKHETKPEPKPSVRREAELRETAAPEEDAAPAAQPVKLSAVAKKITPKSEPHTAGRADAPNILPASAFFEDAEEVPLDNEVPTHQTGPALTEIPGAIFSAPLVRNEEPSAEEPPAFGPRTPLLPTLQDTDEEDTDPEIQETAVPRIRPDSTPARRKAISVVRALRHTMSEIQGGRRTV